MRTTFYVSLNIKTPEGFETFGTFDLGNNREKATEIFEQLKGDDDISEKSILHIDFTEMAEGISLPLQILHCTLEDIADNARIITRETFKYMALKASH